MGHVAESDLALILGEVLKQKEVTLAWRVKNLSQWSLSRHRAIDMAMKYPHTGTMCFLLCPTLTYENRTVSYQHPPTPTLSEPLFSLS